MSCHSWGSTSREEGRLMEERWAAFAKVVADWVSGHQLLIYIVLGILAWALILLNYPLDSLTPIYANY